MTRLLPSPGALVALAALLTAIGPGIPPMFRADGDIGRHVRVGRQILEQHQIPLTDSLSHTRPGGEWVPKEWASQVAMAAADDAFGLAGVAVLAGLLFSASVWLVFAIALGGGAGVVSALLAASLSLLLQLVHLLPRPHLATTALLAAVTLVLVRYRESRRGPLLFLLPLLFAIWANLHAGFPVGLIVVGVFVADAWIGVMRRDTDSRTAVLLSATAIGSVLATMLNPVGVDLWRHVTGHVGSRFFMNITQEFQSPDFHQAYGRMFLLVILGAGVLVGWLRPAIRRYEGALFLLGLAAALTSARHITVFSIISVPWLAVWVTRAIEESAAAGSPSAVQLRESGRKTAASAALTGPVIPIVVGVAGVALALGPFKARAEFDATQFPVDALRAISPESMPPELFNQMRWGGYILYEYPDIRIFMDGHADYFGEVLTREYLGIRHLAPGWAEALDKYSVDWTLTMPQAPISQALELSPQWRQAYADEVAVIHVRDESSRR